VPAHYLNDRCVAWRPADGRGDDVAYLAEVGRPEHTRGCDRQELRAAVAVVLKPWTCPRRTQTASPGLTSTVSPSIVQVVVPSSP
jgi:hypothetical protein